MSRLRGSLFCLLVVTLLLVGLQMATAGPVGSGGQALAAAQGKPKKKAASDIKRQMKAFAKDIRRHDEAVGKQRRAPAVPKTRAVRGEQANPAYDAPETPQRMIPGEETTTPVRITNVTQQPLPKTGYVLSYHWETQDGRDITSVANRRETPLPGDLAPGGQVTVDAKVEAPDPLFGNHREEFVLKWDLYDKTTRKWLSQSAGVAPLAQGVTVESASSGQLGLEKFYQYSGMSTGAGSTVMVNQSTGNVVFGYNAFSNPSRGLATFVRLSYNSLDTSDSMAGPGWAISASSVQRLGTPLQFYGLVSTLFGHPMKIVLVDGDGTSHTFRLNKHDSHDRTRWDYDSPAGVNVQLRKNPGDDRSRTWVMTKPDRTQIFFDDDGYQTFVRDGNGNELAFGYQRTLIGGRNTGMLKTITDPHRRQTLTLDYYQHGDDYTYFADDRRLTGGKLANPHLINKLKSITDVSGRKLAFAYSDKGLLQEVVDGAGDDDAKVFGFFYDREFLQNPKLVRINDPLGHGTQLSYFGDTWCKWRLESLTDRRGKVSRFAYGDPDGHDGSRIVSRVTDAIGHAIEHELDGYGRTTKITNAVGETTRLAWDADNNVRRMEEGGGAVSTWSYDQETGYPLEIRDAEGNKNGTDPIRLGYRKSLDGHVADLVSKSSPEGRKWTFAYDDQGNLTSVTAPKGNATRAAGDYTTTYRYDGFGQLTEATDANGHKTWFSAYTAQGYPQITTDAKLRQSSVTYDARGQVLTSTDARRKTSTFTYDVFGRPLSQKVPLDQANDEYIFTPAPEYDKNDSIVKQTAPNGAVTTFTHDAGDLMVGGDLPKDEPDDSDGPSRRVTYGYDDVGNLVRQTEPKGNLTPDPGDFTTTHTYDAVNRLVKVTNAVGDKVTYQHDQAGNVSAVADPKGHTTRIAYDLNHRPVKTTDAAGNTVAQKYTPDGLVSQSTDQEGVTTVVEFDENGRTTQVKAPHTKDGDARVTRFEYDRVGNRTKVITPRGVLTEDDDTDFVQETVYDELNQPKEQIHPYDKDDERYNKPVRTTYEYDETGRVSKVSAPPSQGESTRNDTTFGYFDNGLLKTSTDPWGIVTGYRYNPLGQQSVRTLTSAGGSSERSMSWTYYPDGKLKARSDDGLPVGRDEVLVDNADSQNVSSKGEWPAASTSPGYHGQDYRSHAPGSGSDSFTWNLNIPKAGKYEVFVKYAGVGEAAKNAKYTVEHQGGSDTKKVDQSENAGKWESLGRFSFAEGNTHKITLSDDADGTVVADAVKLVRDNTDDPDTENKDFVYKYDANGNQELIQDKSSGARVGEYALVNDALNRVQRVTESKDGARKTTEYEYDPNGNPVKRTHPDEYAEYQYNALDQVTRTRTAKSAADPGQIATFSYDKRGARDGEVKGNGNTVGYDYFADGLLRHQIEKKPGGTLVAEHTLAYDPNGQKTRDESKKMNADDHSAYLDRTTGYTYDPRDRVRAITESGTGPEQSEAYVHDDNNNVIGVTTGGRTTTFDYDRDRLVTSTAGGVTAGYNHDPLGRLDTVTTAGKVIERYGYDGFDRVTEHTSRTESGDTVKTRYAYDPLDRTAATTVNAGTGQEKTTTFNYLGLSGEVSSEQVSGRTTQSYRYSPWGERLSQIKSTGNGEETSFYGYNPHTDVETLTDDGGDTKATYGYTGYGNNDTTEFTGVDKPVPADPLKEPYNPYRFGSKRWDGNTGTYDTGFREYSPGLNRFLSRDSYTGALADLGLTTDPFTNNRYAFGGGNPVNRVEIDGHESARLGSGGGCGPDGINCGMSMDDPAPSGSAEREPYSGAIPTVRGPSLEEQEQAAWRTAYSEALDEADGAHGGAVRHAMDDLGWDPLEADNFQDDIDYLVCERVGKDCERAQKYLASLVIVGVFTRGSGDSGQKLESAETVERAVQRQLARGWDDLIDKHLSPGQKQAYNDAFTSKEPWKARRLLGHALHNATAADLDRSYPGRWEYNASRGPDFRDRQNQTQVELTTRWGYASHWAKGGQYRGAMYVLYRGPKQVPQPPAGPRGSGGFTRPR